MLRSSSAVALALALCACEPDLPQDPPTPTVTAVFDPTASKIPLPNDLVFLNPANGVCPPSSATTSAAPACAQAELLASFTHGMPANAPAFIGEFPSDQEVAITIDFTETTYVNGRAAQSAPSLDLASITPATLYVIGVAGNTTGMVPIDPPTDADYVKADDHGTLTVHHQGHTPWPTGSYVVVMRGGDGGVKTTDMPAIPVSPSTVFDLIEQGKDMTDPKNLGLLKAQAGGSTMDALALGAQLNLLINIYKGSVFPAADLVFPHEQMAIASTFKIAPTFTNVTVDPARGLAPLPIDLLRDPTTGKLTTLAACTLAGSSLDKDGKCPNPAAAGFTTLDGFSTTGAILGPTSDLIQAATVTSNSLRLYDLSTKPPTLVPASTLIIEPCEFTSACGSPTALSPVIAFQPAGATAGDPTSLFRTKPLKDNTDYAVVMTSDIKDKAGNPIGPGTVAKVLRFTNPLVVGGHSALLGIDDATANALEKMRKQLAPVFTTLSATDAGKVAMAYTFHTETVLEPAIQLAALPYTAPTVTGLPGPVTARPAGGAGGEFERFGVPAGLPTTDIDEIIETTIKTFDALDPATGAFIPDPSKAVPIDIRVLIAVPVPTNAPLCAGSATLHCAPMMVFRHGLGRGRADMLLIANTFAKAGMVTVAIDAAKHGDRSLCSSNPAPGPLSTTGCVGTCTPLPNAAGQGDPPQPGPPGTCSGGLYIKRDLAGKLVDGTTAAVDGIPVISANYLVTANFFRTRDTLRQDLIDQSQLIRALAVAPTTTNHTVLTEMLGRGVIIDPLVTYFSGQSLGAIQGTLDVATNPRISKAGLNVGGGTIVDVFTNSPAFAPLVGQLLAGLGIDKVKDPSKFLQFLTVAKTVLDPADPVNFAGHLTANTLPNLLPPFGGNPSGEVPQAAKKVLIQVANCDQVVPNPMGLIWSSNIAFANTTAPGGPLPTGPSFFAPNATGTFQLFVGAAFNPADFGHADKCTDTTAAGKLLVNSNPSGGHGFLLSFENSLTGAAQANLAGFMTDPSPNPTVPSVVRAQ